MQDFIVQDDGPECVLRPEYDGKGKVRYEIKAPENEEESIEGVHYFYRVDYSLLVEGEDYDIVERGPYISVWNIDAPIPTQEELQSAWEAYLEAENNKPYVPTEIESLKDELTNTQIALTDTYEQLLASQDETTSVQEALVDVYEQLLALIDSVGGGN
jgi:hypothetical protein